MPVTVLLDLNALNDLFRDSDQLTPERRDALKDILRTRTSEGSVRVLATGALFDEMLGTCVAEPGLFHKVLVELRRLSCGKIIRSLDERYPLEIRTGGRLTERDLFMGSHETQRTWQELENPAAASAVNSEVQERKNKFKSADEATRFKVQQRFTSDLKLSAEEIDRKLNDEWLSKWREVVTDLCASLIRDEVIEGPVPDPARLPSLWNFYAIRVAHIHTINKSFQDGPRKIERSAVYDLKHYADAAYADLFVTSDGRFLETIELLSGNPPRSVSLSKFASELLGSP